MAYYNYNAAQPIPFMTATEAIARDRAGRRSHSRRYQSYIDAVPPDANRPDLLVHLNAHLILYVLCFLSDSASFDASTSYHGTSLIENQL